MYLWQEDFNQLFVVKECATGTVVVARVLAMTPAATRVTLLSELSLPLIRFSNILILMFVIAEAAKRQAQHRRMLGRVILPGFDLRR